MGAFQRLRWPGGLLRAFTLSYDDGCLEDFILAEMMEKYGVKGTFNISVATLRPEDKPDPEKRPNRRSMHPSELLQFVERFGDRVEIASHGLTHPILQTLSVAERSLELIENRRRLEEMTGRVIRGMAFCMSNVNGEVVFPQLRLTDTSYARMGSNGGKFTLPENLIGWKSTCHHTLPREELYGLADKFLALEDSFRQEGALFFVWGHTFEFTNNGDWDKMEGLLEKVGNRRDVWYATCQEIADYMTAYRSLVFSAVGDRVYNPSAIPVYLERFRSHSAPGVLYRLEPGKETKIEVNA